MTTGDADDWVLATAGDGEAFGRIYDRHRDRVFRHSLRLVAGVADADDVVAITFLEAWRRRDQLRLVDESALPWLLVTATNAAHNLRRSAFRYRALLAKLPAEQHAPDHSSDLEDGEAMSALRRMSVADQRVLTLCVLEGLSEREAASVLGVPTGTVKSRLSRARARLKARVPHQSQSLTTLEEKAHGS